MTRALIITACVLAIAALSCGVHAQSASRTSSKSVSASRTSSKTPTISTTSSLSPTHSRSATSTPLPAGVCGNGVVDGGEMCDGGNLAGHSCVSRGFHAGSLSCTASCELDTSACTNTGINCFTSPAQTDLVSLAACFESHAIPTNW